MQNEGPPLQQLTHRLAECPPEFLALPRANVGGKIVGEVVVAAVVGDVLDDLGKRLSVAQLELFAAQTRNHAQLVLLCCWILHDEWFIVRTNESHIEYSKFADDAWRLLSGGLETLSQVVEAPLFVSDADRREELVRVVLSALQLRPAGENLAQAQSRLTTLDSIERQRVVLKTRAAQQRAQAIREAMQEKARQEAAARYTRE